MPKVMQEWEITFEDGDGFTTEAASREEALNIGRMYEAAMQSKVASVELSS